MQWGVHNAQIGAIIGDLLGQRLPIEPLQAYQIFLSQIGAKDLPPRFGAGDRPRRARRSDGVSNFDIGGRDRKSTRLNSSHVAISYAVCCLKKKRKLSMRRTRTSQNVKAMAATGTILK